MREITLKFQTGKRVIHLKHTRSSLQLQQATLRLKTSKLTALLSTLVIIALSRLPSQTTRMALSFSPPSFSLRVVV